MAAKKEVSEESAKKTTAKRKTAAKAKTADKNEVLEFYTQLLRMERDAKIAEAIKAAEFFVKYYGMIEKDGEDESKKVVIVDDIAAVKEND